LYKFLRNGFLKIQRSIELSKYNDFTIAELFRKQGAQIGLNNRIELRDLGTEPYLIKIGDHCTIAPYVSFMTHDGGTWVFTDTIPDLQKFGKITILNNCFIGMYAMIMGNVTIGPNSIVGAGAIVTKDVPPNVVVAGIPAKIICPLEEYKIKVFKIWQEQKPAHYMEKAKKGVVYKPEEIQKMKNEDFDLLRKHLMKKYWNIDT
jgi:acetyltransferase-like isoleucine patch superfamily enzyme